jgi:hypothetical protein
MYLHFLLIYGRLNTRQEIRMGRKLEPGQWSLVGDDEQRLLPVYKAQFYMWVIHSLHMRGTSAQLQVFYVTAVMMFRGMSRRGVAMFSKFKMTLDVRAMDRYRKIELAKENKICT